MSNLVGLAVQGDLTAYAKDFEKALARANTKAVRSGAGGFRGHVRRQITRNFDGAKRLGKTLFKRNDPKSGYRLDASSSIEPKAVYQAGRLGRTAPVDLIDLFTTGGMVTAHGHTWLALPTKDAPQRGGRGGSRYATPAEAGVKLKFLKTAKPNEAVLVPVRWTRGGRPPVLYVLLKMAVRRVRIDTAAAMTYGGNLIPVNFDKNWNGEAATLSARYGRGG